MKNQNLPLKISAYNMDINQLKKTTSLNKKLSELRNDKDFWYLYVKNQGVVSEDAFIDTKPNNLNYLQWYELVINNNLLLDHKTDFIFAVQHHRYHNLANYSIKNINNSLSFLDKLFIDFCIHGELEDIIFLVKICEDNQISISSNFHKLIMIAFSYGNNEIAEYIHKLGYNFKPNDLVKVIEYDNFSAVKYIVQNIDNLVINNDIMIEAIDSGNAKIFKYLFKKSKYTLDDAQELWKDIIINKYRDTSNENFKLMADTLDIDIDEYDKEDEYYDDQDIENDQYMEDDDY